MIGTVTKLIPDKGYGFIRGEGEKEYFFHHSEFLGQWETLKVDFTNRVIIAVDFSPVNSDRGPRASEVTRVDKEGV